MGIKIKFDSSNNPISPTLILTTKSGRKIGKLNPYNLNFISRFNDRDEINFNVNKESEKFWKDISDFKLICSKEWKNKLFEIYVEQNDSGDTYKNVTAISLGEAELSQINLYNFEVNTEDDISRDGYEPTVLCDKNNPSASLLHKIISFAPHYSIGYVGDSVAKIQRTFKFDKKDILSSLKEISKEIACVFEFDCHLSSNGKVIRQINVYDLSDYCEDCGHRDKFNRCCTKCGSVNIQRGYGEDTSILVSTKNLAKEIAYTVDSDSVKNWFRLRSGDELMDATIANCSPSGSMDIFYVSDELKNDMSNELIQKLDGYNERSKYYEEEYIPNISEEIVLKYNALVDKYSSYENGYSKVSLEEIVGFRSVMKIYYDVIDFSYFLKNGLMPKVELSETNSETEVSKLTPETLPHVAVKDPSTCYTSTATNAVISMAKVIVDKNFKVYAENEHFDGSNWSGVIVVENYSDENDTSRTELLVIEVTGDYEQYVKSKIGLTLNQSDDQIADISKVFALEEDEFADELKKYSLIRLNSFYDCCQKCLDVLMSNGAADKDALSDDVKKVYTDLYVPYYRKLGLIQNEISIRENELYILTGEFDSNGDIVNRGLELEIQDVRVFVSKELDLNEYLGDDLWFEFLSYKREDEYKNENYISDGLTNTELFDKANEFLEIAEKELKKAATSQHKIEASLMNLLFMNEFKPILDKFENGNWIRVKTDGQVFKLRLIEYSIDFDDLENLNVEFSDVEISSGLIYDWKSIADQASSLSSSYKYVARQAEVGASVSDKISYWENNGVSLTDMKLSSLSDNLIIDENGLLCREYISESNTYDAAQLKILNKGIYLTDNNWETAKCGIGDFEFYNPDTGTYERRYGVIADIMLSDYILTNTIGIYNNSGTVRLDENCLAILKNDAGKILIDHRYGIVAGTSNLFSVNGKQVHTNFTDEDGNIILDSSGMPSYSNFYLDINTGNAYLRGSIDAISGNIGGYMIDSDFLHSGAGENYIALNGSSENVYKDYAMWAGSENPAYSTYSVRKDGYLVSKKGMIGGINIFEDYLSINSMMWDSENIVSGLYLGLNGIRLGNNFKVDQTGNLYAASGVFSGTVYAGNIIHGGDAGLLDGESISDDTISASKLKKGSITPDLMSEDANYANDVLSGKKELDTFSANTIVVDDLKINSNSLSMETITYLNPDGSTTSMNVLTWSPQESVS